jgi:hypothetical protein
MATSTMLGLAVVVVLYTTIGLLAAAGAICITQRIFKPRAEQLFYAMSLILIAALYLAFVAYFGNAAAWRAETTAFLAFAVFGMIGVRLPIALMVGYSLHGLWDLLHELPAHSAYSFEPAELTAIPLAYGFFCLAFDVCIAVYSHRRRAVWGKAWTAETQAPPMSIV